MRDDHDASLELLDCLGEGVDGAHIQMVSRLVEKEDVGLFHGELREDDAVSETVRERSDGRSLVGTRETEATQLATPELQILVRELLLVLGLHVLQRRLVVRQLVSRVLRVLAELQTAWRCTVPSTGLSAPVMRFNSVDLPVPFCPTMATLESMSIPKLRSLYR